MNFLIIRRNKIRSFFIIFSAYVIFLLTGAILGIYFYDSYQFGLIAATAVFVIYFVVSMYSAKATIMYLNSAQKIEKEDNPVLWNVCENLILMTDIPMPEIYIMDDDSPNAFACGFSPSSSAVCVSTGLLKILNRNELEAVIAHELSHIRHRDIMLSTILIAISSALILLLNIARFSYYRPYKQKNDKDGAANILILILILLSVFAPLIMLIIRLSLSRKREYLADAGAVELCNDPQSLIDALLKLENAPISRVANKECASFFIVNPFKRKENADSLFSTHPSTFNRIKNLQAMLGVSDAV